MENKDKLRVALTITLFAAFSIFFTFQYKKHQKQKHSKKTSCYLKTHPKPQHTFKRVFSDNSFSPFKHLNLTPNTTNGDVVVNMHPYKAEISYLLDRTEIEFEFYNGEFNLEKCESHVWVETESELKELVELLSEETVFAVDTEQHSLHSFLGFTALIQISTKRGDDYLIDTIALHDAMGILRPVFANPGICKVFHGADNDVLWLQRDFHIYVVNLFDTAKACDVLSKPQKSLAYLLETYCVVATNKMLQREDWRQRPLPVEMVQYAQADAHYLLYIANCLASELKQRDNACLDDKFRSVLEASRRSNVTCLQLFSKEIEAAPGESAASSLISRHLKDEGSVPSIYADTKFQDFVRRLCTWRDLMARMHDEHLRYTLSDQAIVALAVKVPTTESDIYTTILQADTDVDSVNLYSSFQSPSAVVCSHWEDFKFLFEDNIVKRDDIFRLILQRHLGPNGTCPLSIYNYALLSKSNLTLTNRLVSKQNRNRNAKQVTRKSSRELFVKKFSCKSPVYHNCRIFANDGRLLCYCDRRKLEWYLCRDLAKLVDDNPPAIMLLFEPKGRPEDEGNDFYIQSKKNICVGCGEGNHYLRYRIIPSCYRMHFPEHLKSHRSHDIVLLCVDCHEVAHAAAEKYKRQIAAELGIPLYIRKVVDSSQAQDMSSASVVNLEDAGVSPLELRTAAMALLRHGTRMPTQRQEELTQVVMKYYGGREISQEDLERALLVGMSPHERRRLEKKRGLSFKQSMSIISDKEPENNNINGAASTLEYTSNDDDVSGLHTSNGETCSKEGNLVLVTDADESNHPSCSDIGLNGEAYATDRMNLNSDKSILSEVECNPTLDSVITSESRSLSNGALDSLHASSDGTFSTKRDLKLSLLGHGPHGKQVVDHLLKEYGRKGFVNSARNGDKFLLKAFILVSYLLAGTSCTGVDIGRCFARGRREFGDFSVYNPAKKASAAVGD